MINIVAISLLIGLFIFFLVLRIPITFALLASSMITAFYLKFPLMWILSNMVNGINSFSLMAIPFFILAGEIMGQGGISERLVNFSNIIVGRFRGGLGHVNVLSSMFFGGISGSAIADTSSIGAMLIPMMKKAGYSTEFSVGITVTSACQGVIIPPSHNVIFYAIAAGGLSVGKLFLGGVLPGIMLGLGLMIMVGIIATIMDYPKGDKVGFKEACKTAREAMLGIFTAVIIVGGVVSGIFTATESAAFACLYAFVITFFVYKEIPLSQFNDILYKSLKTLAMVIGLISASYVFGQVMAILRIPSLATTTLLSISENKIVILILINILLLVLGCIMDMAPLILITTPILLPVVSSIGMDPVHFGIMMILNLAIGLCTPPVGAALFVGCSVGRIKIEKVTKSMLPFYLIMVAVLILVTFVPSVVMYIPNLFFQN